MQKESYQFSEKGNFMSEKYEHEGMPFTRQVAMELIFKTYVGKPPINESTIIEEVYQDPRKWWCDCHPTSGSRSLIRVITYPAKYLRMFVR